MLLLEWWLTLFVRTLKWLTLSMLLALLFLTLFVDSGDAAP